MVFINKFYKEKSLDYKTKIKQNNKLKIFLDKSPEGIVVLDKTCQIEYMNDKFIAQRHQNIIECGLED